MNLDLRTITRFPLRIVGLDPGRARLNAAPDRHRQRRDQAAQWSHEHSIDAVGIEPVEAPGPRNRANFGEGRPR